MIISSERLPPTQSVARQRTKRTPTSDGYSTADESSENARPTTNAKKHMWPSKGYGGEIHEPVGPEGDGDLPVPCPQKRGPVHATERASHPQKRRQQKKERHSAPELTPGPSEEGGITERPSKRIRRSAPELEPSLVRGEEGGGGGGRFERNQRRSTKPNERLPSRFERELQQAKQAERARRRNKWVFAQMAIRLQKLREQSFYGKRQTIDHPADTSHRGGLHAIDSTTRSSSADVEVVHVEGFGERRNRTELEGEDDDVDDYGVLKDRPWSDEETTAVVLGMDKFRGGADRWHQIKLEHPQVLRRRTSTDCLEKAIEIRRVVRDELGIRLGSKWTNF